MIVEGENIRLRPATPEDLPAYTRWFTDPEFRHYMGNGDDAFRGLHSPEVDAVNLSVEARDGTLIGLLFISDIRTTNRNCELALVGIGQAEYRDKGLGTEMVSLALDFCFKQMNMHQVHVVTAEFNERARACYAKLFPGQQVHREWVWANDRFWTRSTSTSPRMSGRGGPVDGRIASAQEVSGIEVDRLAGVSRRHGEEHLVAARRPLDHHRSAHGHDQA